MIGIIDFGAGNLASVANALDRLGVEHRVCERPADLVGAERIVLPGVGHFGAAAKRLGTSGLGAALRRAAADATPVLGICLGLQLLFEGSDEAPGVPGLGMLSGRVVRLEARRVPHMGWNRVSPTDAAAGCPVVPGAPEYVYFAHGFVAAPGAPGDLLATVEIDGASWPAVVGRGRVWATQFHPERSGPVGVELLRRFATC